MYSFCLRSVFKAHGPLGWRYIGIDDTYTDTRVLRTPLPALAFLSLSHSHTKGFWVQFW